MGCIPGLKILTSLNAAGSTGLHFISTGRISKPDLTHKMLLIYCSLNFKKLNWTLIKDQSIPPRLNLNSLLCFKQMLTWCSVVYTAKIQLYCTIYWFIFLYSLYLYQLVVHDHVINKVSYITHDPEDKRTFGYIVSVPGCTTGHQLFALKTEKPVCTATSTKGNTCLLLNLELW